MKRKAGFTLIELLVIIGIIGFLATLILTSLNSARAKSRDARRMSDIRQIMTALELYYNNCGGQYPSALATATANGCTSPTNFASFLSLIPTNPTPNGATYVYTAATGNTSYTLTFTLEGPAGGLLLGNHTASPRGIQ